jgi:endonuclease/exonuclease/phosphatase family metal-dependent hydrolase
VLVAIVSVALALATAPASARPGRPGAPFVVASTPDSVMLTWSASGADRYRVAYSRSFARATSSSAATRTTDGRAASLTVTGLRAGQRYCFSVRALRRDRASRPSAAHCHSTLRRANRTSQPMASVVTYNVCGSPRGCGSWRSWPKRQSAVLGRIDDSRADIVALQETGGRRRTLGPLLEQRGFAQAGHSRDEVIYYRTSRFEVVTDGAGRLPRDKTFTWTALRDRQTSRQILVANTHLTHGGAKTMARVRRTQTTSLVKQVRRLAGGRPVVLAGDFNSDLTHPDDTVGALLGRAGYRDTYQGSAAYTRPYLNSFNGYDRSPRRNTRWGGHIDRIFTLGHFGATDWEVVARLEKGRYAGRWASDHNPVRVSLFLP